ncbi:MAG: oligogalacturonate lyase family protein [Acidobacteriaceae bacterium]|nr:oligogalacturonate lyase family protein [Acidobacteriaceae bacterium]
MIFRPGFRLSRAALALVPLAALTLPLLSLSAVAQRGGAPRDNKPSETGAMPPKSWIDKDTGHRVLRVSDEPNSGAFYFNVNEFTPDHKQMIYNSPDGIRVVDLATMTTKMLVPNLPPPAVDAATGTATADAGARGGRGFGFGGAARAIVVGHKTNSVFFTRMDPATRVNAVYAADTNSGAIRKLINLPPHVSISTINADETLAAGTYNEADCPGGDPNAANAFLPLPAGGFGRPGVAGGAQTAPGVTPGTEDPRLGGEHIQAENKGQMMEQRLASRMPLVLFTIRLEDGPKGEKAGYIHPLLHSTDWVNHLLFSPTDATLLMYCHEGPWQKVDRIWMIHTDGTHNTLIHQRTMYMEIAGHEFWGLDGKTIWYDWQPIKGQDFYLAGYNLETHKRVAYHMERNDWSIHFNLTQDLDLFCGDGGDPGQVAKAPDGEWIKLFYPQMIRGDAGALNSPTFWQPGVFHDEHLVNMAHQNYRAEPNPRFSPDKKYVFFTSNMFGRSYVFAAEVAKATDLTGAVSTPELARQFNPIEPTPTSTPK